MIKRKYSYPILILLLGLLIFTQVGFAEEAKDVTKVNISHNIQRSFKPEVANINVEVWSLEKELEEAYTKTTESMNEVTASLDDFDDLTYSTTSFSVNQRYVEEEDDKRELYYEVSTMVKVETTNLDQLGTVIQDVISKGATNIRGISYGLTNPEKAKNQVIKEGIAELKTKADVIKESLPKESYEIKKIDINDHYNIYNYNYGVMRTESAGAGQSLPAPEISPQNVNINVNFNVEIWYK